MLFMGILQLNLSLRGLIPRMGRLVNAVLDNAGQISAEFAWQFAELEFEKYRVIRTSCSNPILIDSAIRFLNSQMISNN